MQICVICGAKILGYNLKSPCRLFILIRKFSFLKDKHDIEICIICETPDASILALAVTRDKSERSDLFVIILSI